MGTRVARPSEQCAASRPARALQNDRAPAASLRRVSALSSNLVRLRHIPIMLGTLADIRDDTDRLRTVLSLAINEHPQLLKWYRIKLTTTGTKHLVLVIPTRRLRRLRAAFRAVTRQNKPIHRATVPQGSKVIARRMRAKINHKHERTKTVLYRVPVRISNQSTTTKSL